jgi:hypothetical protein
MGHTLSELRKLIGTLEGSTRREYWPWSDLPPGLPKGAITEVCGHGKTEFVVRFLKEQPEIRVAWIEPDLSIYPSGILQRAVNLDRVLFIEAGEAFPWAIHQVFKSNLFEAVVLSRSVDDLKLLRRFQLGAEKADASLILISDTPSNGWPVALQLHSSRDDGGRINIDVIRKR